MSEKFRLVDQLMVWVEYGWNCSLDPSSSLQGVVQELRPGGVEHCRIPRQGGTGRIG